MSTVGLNLRKIIAISCIVVCITDVVLLFVLGNYYPRYSQLKNTMSSLGATVSPVSEIISVWWIFIGIVFIFFGIVFRKTFGTHRRTVKVASALIVLYGLGEGIGSGVFKADRIGGKISDSFILHDIAGGIGVISALLLPLVMLKVITKESNFSFYRFSWIVFSIGFVTMLLFTIHFSVEEITFLSLYKGLWQRFFMVNLYVYFIVISILMYGRKI